VLKPVVHYVSHIEITPAELWEALTNSIFTMRHWWDTSVGSHVSLAINGLVRWHLQRMAGNFVEPQEPAANGEISCEFGSLLSQEGPGKSGEGSTYSVVMRGLAAFASKLRRPGTDGPAKPPDRRSPPSDEGGWRRRDPRIHQSSKRVL
jgi:hypothetical protein